MIIEIIYIFCGDRCIECSGFGDFISSFNFIIEEIGNSYSVRIS